MERLCLTIDETAKLLGVSRNVAYEAARQGKIPTIRLSRRILVPKDALLKLLERP